MWIARAGTTKVTQAAAPNAPNTLMRNVSGFEAGGLEKSGELTNSITFRNGMPVLEQISEFLGAGATERR